MTLPRTRNFSTIRKRAMVLPAGVVLVLTAGDVLLGQGTGTSPWVNVVNELTTQFTGPIAKGLSLIAIVIGGLMFAFGEGGSKRAMAGIIFGLGMAMGAANFLSWLFPTTTP